MSKNNFWFLSLAVLFIISVSSKAGIGLRIALALNAIIVLIDVVRKGREIYNAGRKKEN